MTDRIPIGQAAKKLHVSRTRIRKLVDAGLVNAWVRGGSPKHPRLLVLIDEVMRALDAPYTPPAPIMRTRRPTKIHPAAAAM